MHAIQLSLDSLTAEVRRHDTAPISSRHEFPFDLPDLGPCSLLVQCQRPVEGSSCGDHHCSCHVRVHAAPETGAAALAELSNAAASSSSAECAPAGKGDVFCCSFAVNAVNGSQQRQLAEFLGGYGILTAASDGLLSLGCDMAVRWSDMRASVLEGAKLAANMTISSGSSAALGPADKLLISPMAGNAVLRNARTGLFSDLIVKVGSDDLHAHRVALAAVSPVFRELLKPTHLQGAVARVEVREAAQEAVELLLVNVYGGEADVPLSVALQLYVLAELYEITTDLAQQLRLWLATVRLQPVLLCQLLPAAHALCPRVCERSLYRQAARAAAVRLDELRGLPNFWGWGLDVLRQVVRQAQPVVGFRLAAAWVGAQQRPGVAASSTGGTRSGNEGVGARWPKAPGPKATWPDVLVAAINWEVAAQGDLQGIEKEVRVALSAGQEIPGVYERLFEEADRLHSRDVQQLLQQVEELRGQLLELQLQQQVVEGREVEGQKVQGGGGREAGSREVKGREVEGRDVGGRGLQDQLTTGRLYGGSVVPLPNHQQECSWWCTSLGDAAL